MQVFKRSETQNSQPSRIASNRAFHEFPDLKPGKPEHTGAIRDRYRCTTASQKLLKPLQENVSKINKRTFCFQYAPWENIVFILSSAWFY